MAEASVVIGVIGRPHGVRGAVRAIATGATLATVGPGEAVEAAAAGAPARRLVLAARAGTPERPILTFEGVATRDEAAALTGAELARARAPGRPPARRRHLLRARPGRLRGGPRRAGWPGG